jgi:hypothetical protein
MTILLSSIPVNVPGSNEYIPLKYLFIVSGD